MIGQFKLCEPGISNPVESSFTTEARPLVLHKIIHVKVENVRTSEAHLSWEWPAYNVTRQLLYYGTNETYEINPRANNFIIDSFVPLQSRVRNRRFALFELANHNASLSIT